jgi:hypothetical protein
LRPGFPVAFRRHAVQGSVGPFMIVGSFPFLGQICGFGHGVHNFSGKLFPSEGALEDSMKPFCQGDPGSMKAVSTPAVLHQSIRA